MAGGQGTPTFDASIYLAAWPNTALPLHLYAQLTGYDECAFWGVQYEGQAEYECRNHWSEWERTSLAEALGQAQQMLEDELHYFLAPTFVTGSYSDAERTVDTQQLYHSNVAITRWALVQGPGVRAETVIDEIATVSHAEDPAIVGPIAVAELGSTSEIEVYHVGTERRIYPSKITYEGGELTIEIPRCRLVDPSLLSTSEQGIEYDDTDNFVDEVTVQRVYRDTSEQTNLKGHLSCVACSLGTCEQHSQSACMVVTNTRLGFVTLRPANYSSGTWTVIRPSDCYQTVELNYLAGLSTLTPAIQNMIIRLAHSLMPDEPCGCDIIRRLWERDTHTPDNLSRERQACPFGLSDGAWIASEWAGRNAITRGSILA
jgi:hypothetical protein